MTGIEDKIAKLLRLAGNNSNENEAARAAERAQALMLKHGIELGQISLEDNSRIRIDVETIEGKLDPWRRSLAAAVARTSGGDLVLVRDYKKWSGRLEFLGPTGTVEGMVKLYLYLEGQCDRLSLISAAEWGFRNGFDSAAHSMRWRRSYLLGMASRIEQRLTDRMQREVEGDSMALVPVKDAVQQAMEDRYPNLRSDNHRSDYDPDAALAGLRDGGMVALGDDELANRTAEELGN